MRVRLVGGVGLMLLAAACAKPAANPGEPKVSAAWIRLPAVPGSPAAGYFTLTGGAAADRLIAITSPEAGEIELHRSAVVNGVMTMARLAAVDVAPGETASFAPQGAHAMVFGLDPAVKRGHRVELHFAMASGRTLDTRARVVSAGDDAPGED